MPKSAVIDEENSVFDERRIDIPAIFSGDRDSTTNQALRSLLHVLDNQQGEKRTVSNLDGKLVNKHNHELLVAAADPPLKTSALQNYPNDASPASDLTSDMSSEGIIHLSSFQSLSYALSTSKSDKKPTPHVNNVHKSLNMGNISEPELDDDIVSMNVQGPEEILDEYPSTWNYSRRQNPGFSPQTGNFPSYFMKQYN